MASSAVAVKLSGVPAAALVALAATVTVGATLSGKAPMFTTTSSDSGVVPPLPIGVIKTPAWVSEKVRPMTSAESFSPSAEPGVVSSNKVFWLPV